MTDVSRAREVVLPNGKTAYFEVTPASGSYESVASGILTFDGVMDAIEGVATALADTMQKLKPKSASVEFGVELAAKEGRLLALFVQGEGKANLTVTLEWGETK